MLALTTFLTLARRAALAASAGALALSPAFAATALLADPAALADAMQTRRIVLLGEVHDNAEQHALRVAALRLLLARGHAPAIAFEQFDRERQADIDRARRERPRDADYLIAQAQGNPSWRWELYRPFVQLALDHDLPIVAANLSRADAMKVGTGGYAALADVELRAVLTGRELPEGFARKIERAIAAGHCDLLPSSALPGMAQAQMARDAALATALAPHAARGVVLLTGNGHARRDVGVPFWLPQRERDAAISIAILERDGDGEGAIAAEHFDAWASTARAERPDPCKDLAKRLRP
jgi:uncharacterized iron-regulated protein